MGRESEVIRILRDLIRFDTSNPPGNERPAADYLAGLLRNEGIEPVIVEPEPRRASLVARLKGETEAPALLLSAHLDVVPALDGWEHPPFGGEVHDGYVWGRGAVDMKHMAAMSAVALLELKRRGVRLKRDVVFAAVADEEAGGRAGAGWLVDRRPELIRAGFCLTELGGMSVPMNGRVIVPVQTAQKGFVWFKMRARGQAGHGSRPLKDSAIERLASAVRRLCSTPLPYRLTDTARGFLRTVAATQPLPTAAVLRGLLASGTARLTLKLVPGERREVFYAMLHDTAAVTGLSAGVKVNVIPNCAEALVDGRYLPGVTEGEFLDSVRAVVGPGIELEPFESAPPLEMEPGSELWDVLARVVGRNLPGAQIVPYLIPGMTDAKDYARAGIKTYGFAPVKLGPDEPFASLYHAPNERVSVAGVEEGSRWLHEVVTEFCAA